MLVRLGSQTLTLPPGTSFNILRDYRTRGAEISAIELPAPPVNAAAPSMTTEATGAGASHYVDELMTMYRRAYAPFVHEVEVILEEIIIKLRPKHEEELLTAIHSLLTRCVSSPYRPTGGFWHLPSDPYITTRNRHA